MITLPIIEFAYNCSYHFNILMFPCETFYGWRIISPIRWFEVGKAGMIGPDLVHQTMKNKRTSKKGWKQCKDVRNPIQMIGEETWIMSCMNGFTWRFHSLKVSLGLERKGNWVPGILILIRYLRELTIQLMN